MVQTLPPGMEFDSRPRRRFAGPRVILLGALIIAAITAFIVTRIVQTSGPGPDPTEIPERPARGDTP